MVRRTFRRDYMEQAFPLLLDMTMLEEPTGDVYSSTYDDPMVGTLTLGTANHPICRLSEASWTGLEQP